MTSAEKPLTNIRPAGDAMQNNLSVAETQRHGQIMHHRRAWSARLMDSTSRLPKGQVVLALSGDHATPHHLGCGLDPLPMTRP